MIHLHISRERVVTKSIIDGGKNYKEREREATRDLNKNLWINDPHWNWFTLNCWCVFLRLSNLNIILIMYNHIYDQFKNKVAFP